MTIHKCHTPNCYNMTRAYKYCPKCAKLNAPKAPRPAPAGTKVLS